MNLYLSNHANVRKTNFCNAEGQVLYKSETPGYATRWVPNQKTTISKVIPNSDSLEDMGALPLSSYSLVTRFTWKPADKFTHLATIEWHTIGSSKLIYGGFDSSMGKFMPAKGISRQWGLVLGFLFIRSIADIQPGTVSSPHPLIDDRLSGHWEFGGRQ
jgi:hypothetical protein